jgi:hypothetical protein
MPPRKAPSVAAAPSVASEPLFETAAAAPVEANDVEPPTDAELADFKAQVNEWMKLGDQIRKLNVAARERRTQQKALGSHIQDFMIKHKYDNLSTPRGSIVSSVRKVKAPIKLADVRAKFAELAQRVPDGDPDVLIRETFEDPRTEVEKMSLRFVVPKVSMHLDI